jgi:hypothetical protein
MYVGHIWPSLEVHVFEGDSLHVDLKLYPKALKRYHIDFVCADHSGRTAEGMNCLYYYYYYYLLQLGLHAVAVVLP